MAQKKLGLEEPNPALNKDYTDINHSKLLYKKFKAKGWHHSHIKGKKKGIKQWEGLGIYKKKNKKTKNNNWKSRKMGISKTFF